MLRRVETISRREQQSSFGGRFAERPCIFAAHKPRERRHATLRTHPAQHIAMLIHEAVEQGEIARRGFLAEPTSAELTCIWMAKGKLTKLERDNVYVRSGIDAFRSGRAFVFGGSRVDALARSQKRVLSNTVYSGRATFDAPCEIYYASRSMMVFNMIAAAFATYAQNLGRLSSRRLTGVASPN